MKTPARFAKRLLWIVALVPGLTFAKRAAPPEVQPVTLDAIKYVAPNADGTRAVVQARDATSDKVLWEAVIFRTAIDPALEADVQWVFITKLAPHDGTLWITDERNREWRLDVKTHRVTRLESPSATSEALPQRKFSADDFQAFIKNWDTAKSPILCAQIQNLEQWNAVFGSAAVMRGKKPFAPPAETFDREEILLVARVVPGGQEGLLRFTSATRDSENGQIVFRYRFGKSDRPASYSVKACVGVYVPKREVKKVVFIENDRVVGSLDAGSGRLLIPEATR